MTKRQLRRGLSYESYVWSNDKWVYLGQFGSEAAAVEAQARALSLFQSGGRWTPPPVRKIQIGQEGIRPRTLVDGAHVFDITVCVRSKKKTALSFPNLDAALAARREWLDRINRGDLAWRPVTQPLPKQKPLGAELKMDPPPPNDILFADYAYRWYAARKGLWAAQTLYEYRSAVKRFINPVLGGVPVIDIDERHLAALDAKMAGRRISTQRRIKVRRALTKIMHSTITDGLRTSHPATYGWCETGKVTTP